MTRALISSPVLSLLLVAGCLSPASFESKFESKFCAEWNDCNPDWACELAETDYSDCDFDRKAAKDCLDEDWVCDNSNTALPVIQLPEVCTRAYTNCAGTGTTAPTTGSPGDTGTTTTTSTN